MKKPTEISSTTANVFTLVDVKHNFTNVDILYEIDIHDCEEDVDYGVNSPGDIITITFFGKDSEYDKNIITKIGAIHLSMICLSKINPFDLNPSELASSIAESIKNSIKFKTLDQAREEIRKNKDKNKK